jgi:hypothetical protein
MVWRRNVVRRLTSRSEAGIRRGSSAAAWIRTARPMAGAALLVFALAPSITSHAATYKWVDEKGVIHYTDKMPPEDINKGRIELNKQGVPVKATEPAPTPEQRRANELEEQRKRDLAKQQDDQARRDRALLSSYTSESEIDLARNRSLRTIESVVQSSKAYAEQLGRRRAGIEAKKKTEYVDKPMPPTMERELESINAELTRQDELLTLKQREVIAVNAKYDADKKRWRELIAAKGGEAALLSDVNTLPAVPAPPAKK